LRHATLHRDALRLARRHGLRVTYDAQYLALAVLLDADLWTADERLFTVLAPSLPWVRLIGDYQPPAN
jgi:predicted nucleic acid-binding protein